MSKRSPQGAEPNEMLRKTRQAETASHLDDWAYSPGLQPPTLFTDAENAKRFRDKAADALQMADLP